MQFYRVFFSFLAVIGFMIVAFWPTSLAQSPQSDFSDIHIKNFGQLDERFYRGAEPKEIADFQALKALGINTVIDLQAKPEPEEKGMAESLGMRYVNIPMVAKKYPLAAHVKQFKEVVDDSSTGKFFVHCAGGRHRTGVMGAVYRFDHYGWDFDHVYAEMKKFDFYTSWGHGDFKDFVEDYWELNQNQKAAASPSKTFAPGVVSH